jgi:hypothetical protein
MEVAMIQMNPKQPRVIDNDRGGVFVTYEGRQVRGWSYQNDDERRIKMGYAREYVEGWMDSLTHNAI